MTEKKATPTTAKVDSRTNFSKKSSDTEKNKRWSKKPQGKRPSKPRDDFEERVVKIKRVTKVVTGGRTFRFSALVVVGNHKGIVGYGTGKANEVPDAIKKASAAAKKNTIKIPFYKTTIPHEIVGKFGASNVLMKPAKEGTGIISGGPARTIIELSGIQDIYTKSLGSNTAINMVRATFNGLKTLRTAAQFKALLSNVIERDNTTVETNKVGE